MPKSSKLFLFPDVNVWVALSYEGHIHHKPALTWFQSVDDQARLCFCRITQISFLRLLTTQAIMGAEVLSQAAAWNAYDQWREDGRVIFVDEPVALESNFRTLSRAAHPSPKDWADSYLAAFAVSSGFRLVTFDQAFRSRVDDVLILRPH
jgi:uncharacterized protein